MDTKYYIQTPNATFPIEDLTSVSLSNPSDVIEHWAIVIMFGSNRLYERFNSHEEAIDAKIQIDCVLLGTTPPSNITIRSIPLWVDTD